MILPLLIVHCFAFAQPNLFSTTDSLPKATQTFDEQTGIPAELKAFNEKGYVLSNATYGDLNADGDTTDALILLTDRHASALPDKPLLPRIVKLLLRNPDGTLKMMKRNSHLALNTDEGGARTDDPFERFVIKNGFFTIEEAGGMLTIGWEDFTTFHFDGKGDWYLYKYTQLTNRDTTDTGSTTHTAKNFGKVSFDNYDVTKTSK